MFSLSSDLGETNLAFGETPCRFRKQTAVQIKLFRTASNFRTYEEFLRILRFPENFQDVTLPPGQALGESIFGSVGANVEADGGVDGARVRALPCSGQILTGRWTVNSRDARLLPRPVNALKLLERSPNGIKSSRTLQVTAQRFVECI